MLVNNRALKLLSSMPSKCCTPLFMFTRYTVCFAMNMFFLATSVLCASRLRCQLNSFQYFCDPRPAVWTSCMLASSRHNTGFLILLFNLGGCNIALNRLSWLCDKTEIPDFDNEVYCVGLFSNTYHSHSVYADARSAGITFGDL